MDIITQKPRNIIFNLTGSIETNHNKTVRVGVDIEKSFYSKRLVVLDIEKQLEAKTDVDADIVSLEDKKDVLESSVSLVGYDRKELLRSALKLITEGLLDS